MRTWPEIYIPPFKEDQVPTLKLHDSFAKKILPFPAQRSISMYVCGITPYDATHLGHAATYLAFDLLQRFLRVAGHEVAFVENVTDIDDPLFERAERDREDWSVLGSKQTDLFLHDMTNLRLIPPSQLVRVTEAMDEIIAFVEELIAKGITYRLDSNIYLDIAQITDFSDLPLEMKDAIVIFGERGGDPERSGKRHPLDPLLWRESGSNEPSWSTSFGEGRPGWHIECNAISGRLRNGGMITLQGGGSDLIFPHHYMTMIQARARYGHDFAERYVHAGMIGYEGTKMSKSLGNLVFVSELLRTGVHPMAVRIALMMGHYREDREWTGELLQRAEAFQAQLLQILSMESVVDYQGLIGEILDHLSNDLNTPGVIDASARYFERVLSSSENNGGNGRSPGALSRFFDTVLGIAF